MNKPRSIDIAVIVPLLEKYGGAERVVVECIARWQHRHRVTLYAAGIDERLLAEHSIGEDVKRVQLAPYFTDPHAIVLNATVLPRLWHDQIGQHEVYHAHLWPTHLIDHHPMVWYPHEPFRAAYDLRYELGGSGSGDSRVHLYPKLNYDDVAEPLHEPYLRAMMGADRSVVIERIVANSRYSAEYLSKVYGRPVTDLVYPGAEIRHVADLPRDSNLFVTIGQLWSHKRTRVLIEAIARTDETQLMIIGSGPEQARLEKMVQDLGLADRVFFFSGLRNSEIELILARACAFVFAPIREPFGIVVLEAMAAGLPIIAANEGGYTEVCTPESAFLVPPYPGEIAAKITLLQRDVGLQNRMGAAARAVAKKYSWSRTATELEAILAETAEPKASRSRPHTPPLRPLLGAHYYLWYGEGYGSDHWNDNPTSGYVSDAPRLGYYGSMRGTVIDSHLDLFRDMGLDFVVPNLHVGPQGLNAVEWASFERLVERNRSHSGDLRLAVQLVPQTDEIARLTEAIAKIEKRSARDASYLRHDNKPALFWFWSGALDGHPDLPRLCEAARGFVNVATSLRLPAGTDEARLTGHLFEGFAPFSPLELAERDNWAAVWSRGYLLAREAGMSVRIASVSPGYDDTGLRDPRRLGNPLRLVERRDGATYHESLAWAASLDPSPDMIVISTFNEFHENTHIEPGARHGRRYEELTREFSARLRSRMSS